MHLQGVSEAYKGRTEKRNAGTLETSVSCGSTGGMD